MKKVDTLTGALSIVIWIAIGGTLAGAWWRELPWQVPVAAVVVFFGYGFLRAVYQEHLAVEGERAKEQGQLREANAQLEACVAELEARPRTEGEELKHECLQLGTRLWDITEQWIAQYHEAEQYEPTSLTIPNAQAEEEIQSAETDEEKQRAIEKLQGLQSQRMFTILDQAKRKYAKAFRLAAARLLERAWRGYGIDPAYKEMAKDAGKDLWSVRKVAEILCEIGRRP